MNEHDEVITNIRRPRHVPRLVAVLAACALGVTLAAGLASASNGSGEPEARGRVAEGEAPRGQDGPADNTTTGNTTPTTPANGSSSTTAPTSVPTTAPAPATTAPAPTTAPLTGVRNVPVPGVGIVSIADGPRLISAVPADGYTVGVETSAREVHVRFTGAAGRVDVQAEMEDGALRVRVRDERSTTRRSTPSTAPGSPAFDDHGDRTDDSGHHSSDDDGSDDSSGRRGGDDSGADDSGADDHGGHGGDDDSSGHGSDHD